MSIVVSRIIEVSMNIIALSIHVCVDDSTAERAIIASVAHSIVFIAYKFRKKITYLGQRNYP